MWREAEERTAASPTPEMLEALSPSMTSPGHVPVDDLAIHADSEPSPHKMSEARASTPVPVLNEEAPESPEER